MSFFWFHRSWPLFNFSSFSGKCAAILVSGDALFNTLAGLCSILGNVCLRASNSHFLGKQRVF